MGVANYAHPRGAFLPTLKGALLVLQRHRFRLATQHDVKEYHVNVHHVYKCMSC